MLVITCLALAYHRLPDTPRCLRYLEYHDLFINASTHTSLQLHLLVLKAECLLLL